MAIGRPAVTMGLLATGFVLGSLLIRGNSAAQEESADPPAVMPGSVGFDNPLGGSAERASQDEAEGFLSSKSETWPTLPDDAKVVAAWLRREDGFVAFELEGGPTILLQPDSRSEEAFAADAGEMGGPEGEAWPFSLIALRGTSAQVTDIHTATPAGGSVIVGPGPAAVSWLEGGYLITLLGGPPDSASGLSLAELIAFAEHMG